MWKKLTDSDLLGALQKAYLTQISNEVAVTLIERLKDKEYSDQLYVVVGMGHLRLANKSHEESNYENVVQIGIGAQDGKLKAGCFSVMENDSEAECTGELSDIVEFVDRTMIKLQYEG